MLWHTLWLPKGDYLAVHENGFRCRMRLRRCSFLFDELQSVHMGDWATGEAKQLPPILADMEKKSRENVMVVVPKRKKSDRVQGVKARFQPGDIEDFLATVREKCPEMSG